MILSSRVGTFSELACWKPVFATRGPLKISSPVGGVIRSRFGSVGRALLGVACLMSCFGGPCGELPLPVFPESELQSEETDARGAQVDDLAKPTKPTVLADATMLLPSDICVMGGTSWQNFPMDAQSGVFTVEFDARPAAAGTDALVALSSGPGVSFSDFAVLVRFFEGGTIDARDGNIYAAATVVQYTPGVRYHFRVVVDVPSHTYSVYVTPEGAQEQTIGTDFAFRTEQNTVQVLDHWGVYAGYQSHEVCNVTTSAEKGCEVGSATWQNFPMEPCSDVFVAEFDATPKESGTDALVALSSGAGTAFADFAVLVRFFEGGTIDARDGSNYLAENIVPYTPDVSYHFRLVIDVANHTYSVYVTPEGEREQTIATDFAFRTTQKKVPILDSWGIYAGLGSHEVCDFVTSEVPNELPVAVADADVMTGYAPLAVNFDGSGSSDGDGTIASYVWDFGDGSSATGVQVSHSFDAPGVYTVELTVTDDDGDVGSSTLEISVIEKPNEPPVAVADADVMTGYAPLAVNFDGSGSSDGDGTIASYVWDFGDGASATGVQVSHSFDAPGVYTVGLTVTDDDGETRQDTIDVTVDSSVVNAQLAEDYQVYSSGDNPVDWLDTGANNSLLENDSLFKVFDIGGNRVFGATTTETDIHSHYVGSGSEGWLSYEYSGRMMITDPKGGIGVTFLSDYPNSDSYYRLRRTSSSAFHISPHPWPTATITGGITDSGVVPVANQWYRFRIQHEDDGTSTLIRAKVWADGALEPAGWQMDCYDSSPLRRTHGTIGLWSYNTGSKYWDDLVVSPVTQVQFPEVAIAASPTSGQAPLTVDFQVVRQDGEASLPEGTFHWDFDDGSGVVDGTSVSHTYSNAGSYNVVLTLTLAGALMAIEGDRIDILVSEPDKPGVLTVLPADDLVSSGDVGGPFTPSSKTYTLANTGDLPIDWEADVSTGSWLDVSPTQGTLLGGTSTTVTVSIRLEAASLLPVQVDPYLDTVTFTNLTNATESFSRLAALTVHDTSGDTCVTSSSIWQNASFTSRDDVFMAEFDMTPHSNNMDGAFAISSGAVSAFSDCAVIVRFNASGQIDVRNGGVYDADATVSYTAGTNYHFRVVADVVAHTYSVYVTPQGATEYTLATNYLFRSEQSAVTTLSNRAVWSLSGTSHDVCDFAIAATVPLGVDAGPNKTVIAGGSVLLSGSSTGGQLPYSYSWSPVTGLSDSTSAQPIASPGQTTIYTLTVTDSVGATASDAMTVTVQPVSAGLTPIARWDVVPRQRIDAGETFTCGVVAFSKFGIAKVAFAVSGQGYTGPASIDVTEMTYNDRTKVYEYWAPIRADDFTSDGPITVEATVYGVDGGIRNKNTGGGGQGLDPLTLFVNPNGTLPEPEAWVATTGSDSTGQVNNSSRPFATVNKAIDAIRQWMNANGYGNKVDGGIVRLYPGTHATGGSYMGPMACDNEWITVTTAAGGTRANTILTAPSAIYNIQRVRVKGITLRRIDSIVIGCTSEFKYWMRVWVDDCDVIGTSRYVLSPNPISAIPYYFTDSYVANVRRGHTMEGAGNTLLVRRLTIDTISDDAFQAVPMVVSCKANNLDPGDFRPWGPDADIQHSDAWQSPGYAVATGMQNWIVYGFRATDLHYQGLFGRVSTLSSNIAFVNVLVEMRSPNRTDSTTKGSTLCGEYDHLLFWHCSFIGTGGHIGGFGFSAEPTTARFRVTNSSFRGNLWQRWTTTEGTAWTQAPSVEFYDNHYYADSPLMPDTAGTKTVGDPQLVLDPTSVDFGHPVVTSPLRNRVGTPLVPCDLDSNPRTFPADVGAYQY